MTRLIRCFAGLLLLVMANAPASLAVQTLDEIIKRDTVLIGAAAGTPPFGVTNKDQQPDGCGGSTPSCSFIRATAINREFMRNGLDRRCPIWRPSEVVTVS